MGIMSNLFFLILILISILPIMLFIFLEKRERQSIPKNYTIKDYLKEYSNNYNRCKMLELHTKLKLPEKLQISPAIAVIFLIILMYFFKLLIRENFLVGYLVMVISVFGGIFVFLLTKKTTIKKWF